MNALLSAQYLQNWPITIFKTYTHRFHAKAQVNFKNLIKQRYPAKVWIIWRSSLINQSRVFKLTELWLQKKWSQFMFYIAWHFCCQIISIKDSWSKKCLGTIHKLRGQEDIHTWSEKCRFLSTFIVKNLSMHIHTW